MKSDRNLNQIWRQHLPRVHWQRVEVGLIAAGVPDLNGCHSGCEFWIENKWTKTNKVSISPEQCAWLAQRTRAGGRTFVAVRLARVKSVKLAAMDALYLYRGRDAGLLRDGGLAEAVPLGHWLGGPASWNWPEIEKLLLGK